MNTDMVIKSFLSQESPYPLQSEKALRTKITVSENPIETNPQKRHFIVTRNYISGQKTMGFLDTKLCSKFLKNIIIGRGQI